MAKAVKLFTGFTMDFTADKMAAIAADGKVFVRVKGKTRYGYAWGKWKLVDAVPHGMHETFANGPNVAHGAYFTNGKPNIRLPN